MAKNFLNAIRVKKPKRNVFDLSHDVKLSLDMGKLIPTLALECVPGDKFHLSCESLLRFAPLVAPVMHRFDVSMHYFFVPNRILWPNWEKFITGHPDNPAFPTLTVRAEAPTNWVKNGLMDYMGIPKPIPAASGGGVNMVISALPFAAYQMIYQEYFRDENLKGDVAFELVNGNNSGNGDLTVLRTRAWEKDYFTAALPFAQKGAAVELPIGTFQDVEVKKNQDLGTGGHIDFNVTEQPGGTPATASIYTELTGDVTAGRIYADTSTLIAEATKINDLRRAIKLQEWLELNARGGTRYVENILAHYGVHSSDKRLQRPEYITGTKSPVIVSEVLNTTGETGGLPQGNMAGHGVSVTEGGYGGYFCEEHGYIIGIMSVMPKSAYQQGIARHFMKTDKFDFLWPSFAHLGEQEVYREEIMAFQNTTPAVFGYLPRYAEYRIMQSRVAGDFRDDLDFWHDGRIFDPENPPVLNGDFIDCVPDKRIFAVTDPTVNSLYAHVLHKVRSVRPLPTFGTPSLY